MNLSREWNKRGYGEKKFLAGGKEFPGGVEEGSKAVELLVNRARDVSKHRVVSLERARGTVCGGRVF